MDILIYFKLNIALQIIVNYYLYKCILMKSNYVFNLTNMYTYIFNIDEILLRSHRDHGRPYFLVEKMSVTPE